MINVFDGVRPASSLFSIVDASFNNRKGSLGYHAPGNHAPVIPEDSESQPSVARDIHVRCTNRVREVIRDLDRDCLRMEE
jgi:hypothetical protein